MTEFPLQPHQRRTLFELWVENEANEPAEIPFNALVDVTRGWLDAEYRLDLDIVFDGVAYSCAADYLYIPSRKMLPCT